MRSLICRRHCQFFKPTAEEPEKCLGYEFLAAWTGLEPRFAAALDQLPPGSAPEAEPLGQVSKLLCPRCVFRLHGCDYADPAGPADALPCGGLTALADLLADELYELNQEGFDWLARGDGTRPGLAAVSTIFMIGYIIWLGFQKRLLAK